MSTIKSAIENYLVQTQKFEFVFEDFQKLLTSKDPFDTAEIVAELITSRQLIQFVRVVINSINHDFPSICEVPDMIDGMVITPDDCKIMYRKV